jgi:3-oxoacyl-[acyl-carrier-protein] synthase II
MAASNTMHSEPASAISIELGILGANHVLASGCSAGLDAIGIAMMMIQSGICQRALAVAVELPLVPLLLDNYAASGLLASSHNLDPYHPHSDGFIPGEGAAAMALEQSTAQKGHVTLTRYACNADGADPVGIPKDGGRTPELFEGIAPASIQALCPHATGTAAQRTADPAWMRRVFADQIPRVFLLKPMLGHTIGASGMVESTLLADAMASGQLPANRDGLHSPQDIILSNSPISFRGRLAKISHGMGGHNALLIMENSQEIDPLVP